MMTEQTSNSHEPAAQLDPLVRQSSARGQPPTDRNGLELFIGDRCRDQRGVVFVITGIGWNPPGNIFVGHKGRRSALVEKLG